MTLAICLKCGAEKIGALVRCRSCGFEPHEEEDRAKSILLSDHNLAKDELAGASERIRNGEELQFDEAAIQSLAEVAREVQQDRFLGIQKVAWFVWGIVIILGVLLGLVLLGLDYLFGR